jgi:seryl-tRNA synthetase
MQLEDIQITKIYPPEVEELRQRINAIISDMQRELESDVATARRLFFRREDLIREYRRLEIRFREQTRPLIEELCKLENYATVTVSKAA